MGGRLGSPAGEAGGVRWVLAVCELGLTSLLMPKASHCCVIHEHGHVFYLQTPCEDQVWAKSD